MSNLSLAEQIAQLAESQVGVHETTENNGPQITAYQRATNLEVGEWPWCAAFVCWVVKQAILGRKVTFPRPTTAGAWDFERWCRSVDNTVKLKKPPQRDIRRGDLLVYNFSHIGIAVGPPNADGIVPTVEGNTSHVGSVDVAADREGDGVYRKFRKLSQIRSRIRFL